MFSPIRYKSRTRYRLSEAAANEVRANAIKFLNRDIHHLWPKAKRRSGEFRWDFLVIRTKTTERKKPTRRRARFDTQYWTANVNPSDRYILSLPGSLEYRISPLDNTYDNLTIAGDWTDCSLNVGCVEAATISGRWRRMRFPSHPPLKKLSDLTTPDLAPCNARRANAMAKRQTADGDRLRRGNPERETANRGASENSTATPWPRRCFENRQQAISEMVGLSPQSSSSRSGLARPRRNACERHRQFRPAEHRYQHGRRKPGCRDQGCRR